jgi:hypothetical protein
VPPLTFKLIEPSSAPLQEIPNPLLFDLTPVATNSSGSVIVKDFETVQSLASVTVKL